MQSACCLNDMTDGMVFRPSVNTSPSTVPPADALCLPPIWLGFKVNTSTPGSCKTLGCYDETCAHVRAQGEMRMLFEVMLAAGH